MPLVTQALLTGFGFGAIITVVYVYERRSNQQLPLSMPSLAGTFLGLSVIFSLLAYLAKILEPYTKPIEDRLEQYPIQVIVGGVAIAFVLFLLRRRRLDLYGYLEIIVGLTVLTAFAINPFPGFIAFIVGFATPIYIMIRGADNIDKYKPHSTNVETPFEE